MRPHSIAPPSSMRRVKKACVSSSAIPSWWSTQPSRVRLKLKVRSPMAGESNATGYGVAGIQLQFGPCNEPRLLPPPCNEQQPQLLPTAVQRAAFSLPRGVQRNSRAHSIWLLRLHIGAFVLPAAPEQRRAQELLQAREHVAEGGERARQRG